MFWTFLYLVFVLLVLVFALIVLAVSFFDWFFSFFHVDYIDLAMKKDGGALFLICEKVIEAVHQAAWRGERLLSRTKITDAEHEEMLRATFARWKESRVTWIGPPKFNFSLRFNALYLEEVLDGHIAKEQADEWQVFAKETAKLLFMLRIFKYCVRPILGA